MACRTCCSLSWLLLLIRNFFFRATFGKAEFPFRGGFVFGVKARISSQVRWVNGMRMEKALWDIFFNYLPLRRTCIQLGFASCPRKGKKLCERLAQQILKEEARFVPRFGSRVLRANNPASSWVCASCCCISSTYNFALWANRKEDLRWMLGILILACVRGANTIISRFVYLTREGERVFIRMRDFSDRVAIHALELHLLCIWENIRTIHFPWFDIDSS